MRSTARPGSGRPSSQASVRLGLGKVGMHHRFGALLALDWRGAAAAPTRISSASSERSACRPRRRRTSPAPTARHLPGGLTMTATHHPPVGLIPLRRPPRPPTTAPAGCATPHPPTPSRDAPIPGRRAGGAACPATGRRAAAPLSRRPGRTPQAEEATVYAAIVGVPLAGMLGWAYLANRGDTQPRPAERHPSSCRPPSTSFVATNVSALAANATTPATAVQTNLLNAMPCAITNDAKRFLGVHEDGTLVLQTSVLVSRAGVRSWSRRRRLPRPGGAHRRVDHPARGRSERARGGAVRLRRAACCRCADRRPPPPLRQRRSRPRRSREPDR